MISRRILLAGAASALFPASLHAAPSMGELVHDPALPVLGNPRGDVTIAEFFDYLCPRCKALHPYIKRMVREDGGIRLVMKDWLINGGKARYASLLAHAAARQGAYERAHHALMSVPGRLTYRNIADALAGIGLDAGRLRTVVEANLAELESLFARNERQADALGLMGTPSFIVGSKLYPRPLSPDELQQAVAQARADRAG